VVGDEDDAFCWLGGWFDARTVVALIRRGGVTLAWRMLHRCGGKHMMKVLLTEAAMGGCYVR